MTITIKQAKNKKLGMEKNNKYHIKACLNVNNSNFVITSQVCLSLQKIDNNS